MYKKLCLKKIWYDTYDIYRTAKYIDIDIRRIIFRVSKLKRRASRKWNLATIDQTGDSNVYVVNCKHFSFWGVMYFRNNDGSLTWAWVWWLS